MQRQIPDASIAQTMLWIWVAIVVVSLVLFVLWRRWREKHPRPKPEQKLAYSQTLSKRMAASCRDGKAKTTRGPPGSGGPRKG